MFVRVPTATVQSYTHTNRCSVCPTHIPHRWASGAASSIVLRRFSHRPIRNQNAKIDIRPHKTESIRNTHLCEGLSDSPGAGPYKIYGAHDAGHLLHYGQTIQGQSSSAFGERRGGYFVCSVGGTGHINICSIYLLKFILSEEKTSDRSIKCLILL